MPFRLFGRRSSGDGGRGGGSGPGATGVRRGGEPTVLAFLSGKGGCGKSTIAACTSVLLSALYGGVVAVDLDVTNATLTSMLFSVTPDILKEDDGVSTLDYIVGGGERVQLYRLEFEPGRRFNIQVAGRRDLGVPVKDMYVLPAKKATVSYERNLLALAHLSREDVRSSLLELYTHIVRFARARGVGFVILDFPPLRPDQRKVFDGVFTLLEHVPSFIMVSSFDYSAVHGLIAILNQRYSFLKPRTLGFFINMSLPVDSVIEQIRSYIETVYGEGTVFFIRRDPRWAVTVVPPIILDDPSKGAHLDLIRAYTRLGIVDRELVVSKLGFDPETGELKHLDRKGGGGGGGKA